MFVNEESTEKRPCWFVGATWGAGNDQTHRFVEMNMWEDGDDEGKNREQIKSIKVGDRIAIKAPYTRKHNLPFDNKGISVPAMKIKAIGVVRENIGDGRIIGVNWERSMQKEWYFSQYWGTISPVYPGGWKENELIEFTFNDKSQNIEKFRNDSQWYDRFGNSNDTHVKHSDFPDDDQVMTDNDENIKDNSLEYLICNIMDDGCFIDEIQLEKILERLKSKKNIILQGPPGTGKTWLAKRLAFALMGQKNDDKLRAVQFHPNLGCEQKCGFS